MKRIYNIFTGIAAVMFCSCSLEEVPGSFPMPQNYYQTVSQCKAALNSCYYPLKSYYSNGYFHAVEAQTDLFRQTSTANVNATLTISPSSPGQATSAWQYGYLGVKNACACIAGIQASPLSSEKKFPLMAEARIMLAMYYYHLTSFFGNVPFYENSAQTTEELLAIAHLPRMSADLTRATLIEELLEIAPQLEQVKACEIADNRVGAAAAWMLIAKMAMWNKDWDNALTALDALEAIYGELSQYPLEDIKWRYKNTPESIFEIQHEYVVGGLNYTSTVGCYVMPYPHEGGTINYGGVDIEELGKDATCYMPLSGNSQFYSVIMGSQNVDKRWNINLAYNYQGHSFKSSTRYPGPKFWCPNMYGSYDSNNYPVFRYADAVLMKAEALNEKYNGSEEAVVYLNKVKSRGGIPALASDSSYEKIRDEIRNERARELCGEFMRKLDLVRWGIWYDAVRAAYEASGKDEYGVPAYTKLPLYENMRPCHEYYPIPDQEVRASGGALDNDEYKKYGL